MHKKMGVQLRRLGPHSQVKELLLTDKDSTWTAGRGSNSDIFTLSRFASRTHFSIIYRKKNFYIYDHGSSNGTFVNDEKINSQQEYPLPLNSIISVGVLSSHQNEPDCIVLAFEPCKEKEVTIKMESHVKEEVTSTNEMTEEGVDEVPAQPNHHRNIKEERPEEKTKQRESFDQLPAPSAELRVVKIKTESENTSKESHNLNVVVQRQEGLTVKSEPVYETLSSGKLTENKADMVAGKRKQVNHSDALSNSTSVLTDAESDLFEPEGYADEETVVELENLTKVDGTIIGNSQLSYSMTEDFIEISDTEDDLVNNMKVEIEDVNYIKPELVEIDDYDDEVICLDVIKYNKENHPPVPEIKIEDDDEFTETDKKWFGKLFKTEEECCSFIQSQRQNADSGESGEFDDDWLELVTNCAEEIGQIILAEHGAQKEKEEVILEKNERNAEPPKKDNFPSQITGHDNSTVIGVVTLSPEGTKEIGEKPENCSKTVKKRSVSGSSEEKINDIVKKIKLNDPSKFGDRDTRPTFLKGKPTPDISSSGSSKKPSPCTENYKVTQLICPADIPALKRSTKKTQKKKTNGLDAYEKKRIKDQRRKKLRELSLREPPKKDKRASPPKVLAPLKVKITRKNRSEYLCHQIAGEKDLNGDKTAHELETNMVNSGITDKDQCIPKATGTVVTSTEDNSHVVQVNNSAEKEGNGTSKERSSSDKLGLSDNIENLKNVNVIVEQDAGRVLKSCLKKIGCSFMKSNRPIVPLKSVRFHSTQNVRYYETENRISKKTTSILQNTRNKTPERRISRSINIIAKICSWNASWLEECKTALESEFPPPFKQLKNVQRKFQTHENYMKTFISLLLFELWCSICEKWKMRSGMYRLPAVLKSYTEHINSGSENLGLLKCETLTEASNGMRTYVKEGDLVMIQLSKTTDNVVNQETPACRSRKLVCRIFGYIEKKYLVTVNKNDVHPFLLERCCEAQPSQILSYEILVMNRPALFKNSSNLFQITGVYNISSQLIQCQAVGMLPVSPLCQSILSPNRKDMTLESVMSNERITFNGSLDDFQREVVLKLVSSCVNKDRNLLEIQGGPGTGKTHLIMAFIIQLLFTKQWKGSQRPKILYCSHSNVVVDDMAFKLKNYRQTLSQELRYKLVRFGDVDAMKSTVKDVSSCCLGLKNDHHMYITDQTKALDEKIKVLVADLQSPSGLSERDTDDKSSQLHAYVKEREMLKCTRPVYSTGQRPTPVSESIILENADVICATCLDSGSQIMQNVFEQIKTKYPKQKIICIVDEAMHVKESETVVPLQLGVTDLVLVGDSRQLRSPARTQLAQSLGLNQSLFWRILSIFRNIGDASSPVVSLRTQYRMNSAILAFPNKVLYNNCLKDGSRSRKKYNIDDYVVLLDSRQPGTSERECEKRLYMIAVELITEMLYTMADDIPDNNFGIITCRIDQSKNLRARLNRRLDEKALSKIEVNCIENFQGEEFDIVLFIINPNMDCVTRGNVAMTRAKDSLIILTSIPACSKNKFLSKLSEEAIIRGVSSYVNTYMEGHLLRKAVSKNRLNVY